MLLNDEDMNVDLEWPPLPDYGCFPRWPQDGDDFIHPDDLPLATRYIPSQRVLRRDKFDGTYYHYSYGTLRFRLRPVMWSKVGSDGIDIGDEVETTGMLLERELFVATVWGMYYVARKGCILYRLKKSDMPVPRLYAAKDLRLLTRKDVVGERTFDYRPPTWNGTADLEL
jgi:hypothetical protein